MADMPLATAVREQVKTGRKCQSRKFAMPAGQPSAASKAEVEKPSVLQNRPHIGWG